MRMLAMVVCLAALLGASASAGQHPGMVPSDLVAGLLSYGEEPDLRVGVVAPGLPAGAVPADAIVVGSAVYGSRSTTVFAFPQGDGGVVDAFDARLKASGWRSPAGRAAGRAGFVAGIGGPLGIFCRGDQSISRVLTPRPQGGSLFQVNFDSRAGAAMCADRPVHRGPMEDAPMPTLAAPPGVMMTGGAGGSSQHTSDISAHLQTSMSAWDLATHYAAQLREAGWMPAEEPSAAGRVAAQFFEHTDREGTRWWGMLSVTAPPGDLRFVEFRIGVRRNGA